MKINFVSMVVIILITMGFVSAIEGSNQVSFFSGSYKCFSNPYEAYWQNNINKGIFFIAENGNSIFGMCNNSEYSSIWCCPTGMGCFDGLCNLSKTDEYIHDCTDLYTRESCEHAPLYLASDLIHSFEDMKGVCSSPSLNYLDSSGQLCANFSYCGCVWDSVKSVCNAQWTKESSCGGINTQCSWSASQNENLCDGPERKIIVHYSSSSPACGERVKEYSCGVSVELPFFGWISFFISLAVIFIFYMRLNKLNFTNRFK